MTAKSRFCEIQALIKEARILHKNASPTTEGNRTFSKEEHSRLITIINQLENEITAHIDCIGQFESLKLYFSETPS
jgi:hypothetical protein